MLTYCCEACPLSAIIYITYYKTEIEIMGNENLHARYGINKLIHQKESNCKRLHHKEDKPPMGKWHQEEPQVRWTCLGETWHVATQNKEVMRVETAWEVIDGRDNDVIWWAILSKKRCVSYAVLRIVKILLQTLKTKLRIFY